MSQTLDAKLELERRNFERRGEMSAYGDNVARFGMGHRFQYNL